MTITSFIGPAIRVKGSYNLIENNLIVKNTAGILVTGSFNTLKGNNVSYANLDPEIFLYGSHNNVSFNYMQGIHISDQATDNMIVANCLEAFYLNGSTNIFYLNNFLIQKTIMAFNNASNSFDYNGFGNYWSTYNGTDGNNDGIGDHHTNQYQTFMTTIR